MNKKSLQSCHSLLLNSIQNIMQSERKLTPNFLPKVSEIFRDFKYTVVKYSYIFFNFHNLVELFKTKNFNEFHF